MNRSSAGMVAVLLAGAAGCSSGSSVPAQGDGGSHDGAARRDGSSSGSGSSTHAKKDAGSSHGSGASGDAGEDARASADAGPGHDSGHDATTKDATAKDGGHVVGKDAAADALRDARADAGVDSGVVALQSCAVVGQGTSQCGTTGESCCTSLGVDGGVYARRYDLTDAGAFAPGPDGAATFEADPASVSSFQLDKFLVTVARFRQFVAVVRAPDGGTGWLPLPGSGKHTHLNLGKGLADTNSPGSFESGWLAADDVNIDPSDANLACGGAYSTWSPAAGTTDALPINCVNWYEAYAFCIWDGGFLPSESEWEYAAAGGAQQNEYPWGSTAPGLDDTYAVYDCHYPFPVASCSSDEDIAPVGSVPMGAARWGHLNLAGELYEWSLNLLGAYTVPCTDCASLGPATGRVIRGGDYRDTLQFMVPPARAENVSTNRSEIVGFRCARTP